MPTAVIITGISPLQKLFRKGHRYQTSRECHDHSQVVTESCHRSRHSSIVTTPTGLSSGHWSAARIQLKVKFPAATRQNLGSRTLANQLNTNNKITVICNGNDNVM